MKLQTLKRKARAAAQYRGHSLDNFLSNANGTAASAQCKHCHAFVTVDIRLLPNGIDIGGSAVAINCTKSKGE